jgi:hypothetical protein
MHFGAVVAIVGGSEPATVLSASRMPGIAGVTRAMQLRPTRTSLLRRLDGQSAKGIGGIAKRIGKIASCLAGGTA